MSFVVQFLHNVVQKSIAGKKPLFINRFSECELITAGDGESSPKRADTRGTQRPKRS